MLNPSTLIDEMLKKSCLWHMKAWQGLPVQHNMLVASRSFSSPPSIPLVFACEAQGKRPSVVCLRRTPRRLTVPKPKASDQRARLGRRCKAWSSTRRRFRGFPKARCVHGQGGGHTRRVPIQPCLWKIS